MNIILKTGNTQKRVFANRNNKIKSLFISPSHTADDFEDVFNEQAWLSNAFKQNIATAISDTDFAYPSDGENIKKMVQEYLQSSLQLLKNKLNKLKTLGNMPEVDELVISAKIEDEHSLSKWTEIWIEQTDNSKNNLVVILNSKSENEKYNSTWVGEWINQIEPAVLQG